MHLEKNSLVLDQDPFNNYIVIDECDFEIRHRDPTAPKKSSSPNGYVFDLYDPQEETTTQVIKFCRIFSPCADPYLGVRKDRFEREIRALKKAKESNKNAHVIEILSDGEETVNGKSFRYYTMERADEDLASFLRTNELSRQQRYLVCAEMLRCIESLHAIDIYHRDIKPANFLMIGDNWKIADLGLVDSRDRDLAAVDGERERIGPRGWLSPEAINKWLGLIDPPTIDDRSDVFQLAKVMGFVLQGEIFAGQVAEADFQPPDDSASLFSIMSPAFQYCRGRRCSIGQMRTAFLDQFSKRYALA